MNLLRHPAWGRAQETYGEDPHHVGEMAAALTRGLQRHVMACMKHFACNSMENARFSVDVRADERALHEVYLPHFRRVAEEGVASVMSAYNMLNGEWCGESAPLLRDVLRHEWEWDGFVTSDFTFGLRDGVKSVHGGLNIEMPFMQQRAQVLADAVGDGRIDEATVDALVGEIVATLLRFAPQIATRPDPSVVACDAHRALAREAAVASMVLLRNDGDLLPLTAGSLHTVAVLGRLAAVANLGDQGSSNVLPPAVVTPLEGLRAALPDAEVLHSDDDASIASDADVCVVVVGYTKHDEGEFLDQSAIAGLAFLFPPMDHPTLGFESDEQRDAAFAALANRSQSTAALDVATDDFDFSVAGGDRRSLRLRDADETLIAAACARNDNVVVCVMAGSAVVMPWLERAAATVHVWYPGMEGGHALADVLLGVHEPGGRLPFAVPHDEAHLVDFDPDATVADYGLLHGQWKLDADGVAAHLDFGWGLGYTDFSVDAAALHGSHSAAIVDVTATNRGERPGSTVVFVFASVPGTDYQRPPRRLVGFTKVHAEPGAPVSASIQLDLRLLAVRVEEGWDIELKPVTLHIGQHAHDDAAVLETALRPGQL
jgi:beta-glucosidase